MAKKWFILIEGKKEGPFTPGELQQDPRVTLDTLVWKEDFLDWVPIHHVPELKALFEEKPPQEPEEVEEQPEIDLGPYQMVLAAQQEPPHLLIWFILACLIMLYVFFHLVYQQ